MAVKPPLQKEHLDALRDWKICYIGYGISHYLLIVLGVLAAAIVTAASGVTATSSTSELLVQPLVIVILGVISAVSVTVTNALDTGSKYKKFNKAWAILNEAVMRYKTEDDFTIKDVNNAWVTGDNVIQEKTEVKRD